MSRTDTLKSLEIVVESFLDRAVRFKENRLKIIGGINRLDDIARLCGEPDSAADSDLTDRVGAWFAEHSSWIEDQALRPGDRDRIGQILSGISQDLVASEDDSPADRKIAAEVDRWQNRLSDQPTVPKQATAAAGRKIVLRKGPESLDEAGVHPSGEDSIGLFTASLKTITGIFTDLAASRQHLMSILDDTLKSAALQENREALLLSALIVYYLKQNGYIVEPFVRRLKEAERLLQGNSRHA